MHITLSPVRSDKTLIASLSGDVLSLNGVALDFGPLPEGGTLPAGAIDSPWISGAVERTGDEIHLTLLLPHGPNPSQAVAFPKPLVVMVDGEIDLPFDPPAESEPMLELSEELSE